MNELVNLVAQRTGLSATQAQAAVQTVLGFMKQRLPAPIAAEVDKLMAAGAPTTGGTGGVMGEIGDVESVAKGLGGMFGKQP